MATINRSVAKRASSSEGARRRSDDNGELSDQELLKLLPPGMERSFVKAKMHDKSLALAGLSPPPDWEGAMPKLPRDVATLDHDQMAELLFELVKALSTATWQASKAYIEADAYEEAVEQVEARAMLRANESNEPKRKAQARIDEAVVAMRARWRMAYHDYVRFRDLARTLEIQWRTVSRVGGFLGDEVEAEVASAIKRSTRGQGAGTARGSARGELRNRPRK